MASTSAAAAAGGDRLIDPALAPTFRANYNRRDFQFAHRLAGHPLFELPSLIELAERMPDHRDTYWSNGGMVVNDRWNTSRGVRQSITDSIRDIATNDSFVMLKHTEADPVYGPVLRQFLQEAADLCGERMKQDAVVGEVLIMIASPRRITPYHLDGETNFVVQIKGDKTLYVYPNNDPTLVSHHDLERFWAGDHSVLKYEAERQRDANAWDLRAGFAVHVPETAPHWALNKDNVSVALSVNYELSSMRRRARIYRMNDLIRRAGLEPTPPGASPWRDELKFGAAKALFKARDLVKGRPVDPYPLWRPEA